jgi:CheY-like chemotaxis protein
MHTTKPGSLMILIADDDADDRMFLERALRQTGYAQEICAVEDGEELLDFLYQRGPYTTNIAPRPSLLILDLNMPRLNGFEALKAIRDDLNFRWLPIVVMSTSTADDDVVRSYNLGVNSFVTKPFNYNRLVEIISVLKKYWLETVRLPE